MSLQFLEVHESVEAVADVAGEEPSIMKHVNIKIWPVTFDHADYDAENDVPYLHAGEPMGPRARRRLRVTSSGMHPEPTSMAPAFPLCVLA